MKRGSPRGIRDTIFSLVFLLLAAFGSRLWLSHRNADNGQQKPQRVNGREDLLRPNDAFRCAIYDGNFSLVKALLKNDPGLVNKVSGPVTPLSMAIAHKHPEIVQFLVANGADVNLQDSAGQTALVFAASYGETKIAQLLIECGAKVEIGDSDASPLHAAAGMGNLETVRLLLGKGANINSRDREGRTPLYWAEGTHSADVVAFLKSRGGR